MKKILLILSLFFAAGLASAAGDPVPGVGVSLEQIPGGIYHTQRDCTKKGGMVIQIQGVAYCGPDVRIVNDGGKIVISSSTSTKSDCPKNTGGRHHELKSYANDSPKKNRKRLVKFKAGSEFASKSKGGDKVTLYQEDGRLAIDIKYSPSRFATGSRGAFKIVVKNKGNKLGKGMLTVVDHMPAGLSVKTGGFRANSWRCKGGMISSSGQDVTCTYNRKLGKKSRATLNLNVAVASAGSFPAGVKEVENCATAFVKDSPGMAINRRNSHIKGDVKVEKGAKSRGMAVRVCDKIKIRHAKSTGSFNLPIGIGIGMGALGGGGTPRGGGAAR